MVLLVGDKAATLALLLILCSVLVTLPNIVVVEANGTTYIRADGSVEGTDTIQRDGNVYTFTDNIYEPLVVEKDNIIIDGAGYTLEGPNTGLAEYGILVDSRSDVTISDVTVQNFLYGICINSSSNNKITKSNITNNSRGIIIDHSSENTITGSQITNNINIGIYVFESSDTNIFDNVIRGNTNDGISVFLASSNLNDHRHCDISYCDIGDNKVGIRSINSLNSSIRPYISDNNITNNQVGIHLEASSVTIQFNNLANNGIGIQLAGSDNRIDRNNFIDNTKQVYDTAWDKPEMSPSVNTWYDGDSGNYWSDYNGTGAYVIDQKNQDPLPKNTPFRFPNQPFPINTQEDFTVSNILWAMIIISIVAVIVLYILIRKSKKIRACKIDTSTVTYIYCVCSCRSSLQTKTCPKQLG